MNTAYAIACAMEDGLDSVEKLARALMMARSLTAFGYSKFHGRSVGIKVFDRATAHLSAPAHRWRPRSAADGRENCLAKGQLCGVPAE